MQQAQRRADTCRFLSTGARGTKKKSFRWEHFHLQALEGANGSNSILCFYYCFTTALLLLYYSFTIACTGASGSNSIHESTIEAFGMRFASPPFPHLFFSPLGQLPGGFTGSNWFPSGKFIVVGGGRL